MKLSCFHNVVNVELWICVNEMKNGDLKIQFLIGQPPTTNRQPSTAIGQISRFMRYSASSLSGALFFSGTLILPR
jgi:hypothetical protein